MIRAKLVTAVLVAHATSAVISVVCLVVGAAFLHTQGLGSALGDPSVLGAVVLLAYAAAFGLVGVRMLRTRDIG